MIDIGVITDALLTHLTTETTLLVGDGIAPQAGGWSAGHPNVRNFVGYATLAQTNATSTDSTFCKGAYDWLVQYSLKIFGATRKQVDLNATVFRMAADDFRGDYGVDHPYRIQRVHYDLAGGPVRNDATDPPFWQTTDSFRVRLVPLRG